MALEIEHDYGNTKFTREEEETVESEEEDSKKKAKQIAPY